MRNRLYAKDIVAGLELMCLLCQSIISVVFFFFSNYRGTYSGA